MTTATMRGKKVVSTTTRRRRPLPYKTRLLLALCVMTCHALFAATYYASPSGTGSGNSAEDPCSISDGFDKIKWNAHTLVLARGRYLLSKALSLPAVQSTNAQTIVMGETGNPEDVILDAQGVSEVMRLDFSCLVTGVTMMNGSNSGFSTQTAYENSAGGVRISHPDNAYGPSIVSNCIITCCINNFNADYKFNSGELNGKVAYGSVANVMPNGILVDTVVTNNSALRYYCGGVLVSSNATVRGCTIAGNSAASGGAGVFVNYGAKNVVFDGCVFSNNTATAAEGTGGGLDCRADGASLMLTNCTFFGNTATLGAGLDAVGDVEVVCKDCMFVRNTSSVHGCGVRLATTAVVRLNGCTFDGNEQTDSSWKGSDINVGGGGVFVQTQSGDGFVSISNCVFRNNSSNARGGGFGHTWKDSVYGEIVNCVFTNNVSYRQGGGMYLREEATRTDKPFVIRNSLFAFNNTIGPASTIDSAGGGVHFVSRGNPILDSCTIVSNNSARGSGGMHHRWGGTVTNCIIAFNTQGGVLETGSAWCLETPSAYVNSCAWPSAEGAFLAANGCVNADPKFMDVAHGDFTLKASSPCRDAGIVEDWMLDAFDLGGNRRVIGRSVDMGCYEFVPCGFMISVW